MNFTRRQLLGYGAGLLACSSARSADAIIRTVLKDVSPDSLAGGATLFHEHLSLAPDFMPKWMALAQGRTPPPPSAAPPGFFMQDLDLMASELATAKEEGVACVVDGGHPDMGRDLEFLKRLSTKSGLPIVASCGFYSQPFDPADRPLHREACRADLEKPAARARLGLPRDECRRLRLLPS